MSDFLQGVEQPCSLDIFSDALDDQDFWQWVFHRALPTDPSPADGDDEWWLDYPPEEISTECTTCGATGACGYDEEGRAMIHTQPVERDVGVYVND